MISGLLQKHEGMWSRVLPYLVSVINHVGLIQICFLTAATVSRVSEKNSLPVSVVLPFRTTVFNLRNNLFYDGFILSWRKAAIWSLKCWIVIPDFGFHGNNKCEFHKLKFKILSKTSIVWRWYELEMQSFGLNFWTWIDRHIFELRLIWKIFQILNLNFSEGVIGFE